MINQLIVQKSLVSQQSQSISDFQCQSQIPFSQSQSKSKIQIQASDQKFPVQIPSIKQSPYFADYTKNFIKGRKIHSYNIFWKNFSHNDIAVLPKKHPFKMLIIGVTQNYRIIKYEVCFSHFIVRLSILNISASQGFSIYFDQKINQGTFGTIFGAKNFGHKVAVKKIKQKQNIKFQIQNAIKEYAFTKVMAALQCGPQLHRIFGFDLIVSSDAISFGLELCQGVQSVIQSKNFKGQWHEKFNDLETSLLLMHQLGICHCDIKPSNIMYSPFLNKFVFIDFGLSEFKGIQVGQMKLQKAKGSFFYSCEEMQKLFISGGEEEGYVDVFYNDFYGLMKSKKAFESRLKNEVVIVEEDSFRIYHETQMLNDESYFESSEKYSKSLMNELGSEKEKMDHELELTTEVRADKESQGDFEIIYVCFLVYEYRVLELEVLFESQKLLYEKINKNLHKIYWIFMEMKCDLSFELVFNKFKELMLKSCSLSFRSQYIFENILGPYFEMALKGNYEKNELYKQYKQQQQVEKQKIKKRYRKLEENVEYNRAEQIGTNQTVVNALQEIIHKLPQNFYPNKTTRKSHSQRHLQLKIELYLTKLTQQDKQQIKACIFNDCECVLRKILNVVLEEMFFKKSHQQCIHFEIPLIEKCFNRQNIFLKDLQLVKQGLIHPQTYTILGINLLTEIVISYVTNFSIPLIILYAVVHSSEISLSTKKSFLQLVARHHLNFNFDLQIQKFNQDLQRYFEVSTQNFKKCLTVLLCLHYVYIENNNYSESSIVIQNLVANVFSKLRQILQYRSFFSKLQACNDIKQVLQICIKKISTFIIDIIATNFFTALGHIDLHRLSLYYEYFSGYCDIYFNTSTQNYKFIFNDQKPYLLFMKRIFSFIIFKVILPKRLSPKYKFLTEIQKFMEVSQLQTHEMRKQHSIGLQKCLFWHYFNELNNEKCYGMAIQHIKSRVILGNEFVVKQTIFALIQLYKNVNNNRLLNQVVNLNNRIFGQTSKTHSSFSKPQNWKNYVFNCIDEQKNDEKQQPQTDSFKNQNQSLKMFYLQQFMAIKKRNLEETNIKTKQFRIQDLFVRSLLDFPLQDFTLQIYVELYLNLLAQIQQNIALKISLIKYIDPNLIHPKIPTPSQKKLVLDTNDKLQNCEGVSKFKKEIQAQEIFHHESQFILILVKYSKFIKNKSLIKKYWDRFIDRIKNLLQGTYVRFLTYLQISSIMKQTEFIQLYQNPVSDPEQILRAKNEFIKSIDQYLNEFTPKNQLYIYEIKNSKFGIDALIKVYLGEISSTTFTKSQITNRLLEVFFYMVKNDQLYRFFIKSQIIIKLTAVLIDIALAQIYEKSRNGLKNFKKKTATLTTKAQNSKETKIFLQIFLFYLLKFAQTLPCSNYTQTIVGISNQIKEQLQTRFTTNFSGFNLKDLNPAQIVRFILEFVLRPIIKQSFDIYAVHIYFQILSFLVSVKQMKKDKQKELICQFLREKKLLTEVLAFCEKHQLFQRMQICLKTITIELISQIMASLFDESQPTKKARHYQLIFFRSIKNPSFSDSSNKIYFPEKFARRNITLAKSQSLLQNRLNQFSRTISRSFKSPNKIQAHIKQKIINRLNVSIIQKS